MAEVEGVVQRLERERVLLHAGHAERRGDGAGGEDEAVVAEASDALDLELPGREVGADHPSHHHVDVLLALEDAPRRVGDVVGVEPGRGHLVEQRLEQVVVVRVDEHDVDRRLRQRLGGGEAAEARSHDHDPVTAHRVTLGRRRLASRRVRRYPRTRVSWTSNTPLSSTETKPPIDGGSMP